LLFPPALPSRDAPLHGGGSPARRGPPKSLGRLPPVRRGRCSGGRVSALLEARTVTKVFGGGLFDKRVTVALDDFSYAIESTPPRVTAIVGESGSGKTTLARLLLGLISPTTGQVLYNGQELQNLSHEDRRRFLR